MRIINICILFFICALHKAGYSLLESNAALPRSAGTAFCGASKDYGAESALLNPSMNALSLYGDFFCAYTRPFGIQGINQYAFGVTVPVKNLMVAFGAGGLTFEDLYFDMEALLSVSHAFKKRIAVGGGINAILVQFTGTRYGGALVPAASVFLSCKLSESLVLGALCDHLYIPEIGFYDNQVPRKIAVGLSYTYDGFYSTSAEIEKRSPYPACLKVSQEILIWKFLFVRGGIITLPFNLTFGLGICWNKYFFDYSYTSHSQLGGTHFVGISYRFKGSSKKISGFSGKENVDTKGIPVIIYEE
ncbi:MAG: hypothetical protein ABIA63_06610 [bacterium]